MYVYFYGYIETSLHSFLIPNSKDASMYVCFYGYIETSLHSFLTPNSKDASMCVYFKGNIETSLHFNTRISLSICFSTSSVVLVREDYFEADIISFRKFLEGEIPAQRNCPHSRERICNRLCNRDLSSVS